MTILTEDNETNIKILKEVANKVFAEYPIVAQLTIAQGILEGRLQPGNNPSSLALRYNNLFGMKARASEENNTLSVELPTHEYVNGHMILINAWFRKYNSIEDCLQARKQLFQLPRYQNLYQAKDFIDIAHIVRQDGYATDPEYPQELISIYNEYIK